MKLKPKVQKTDHKNKMATLERKGQCGSSLACKSVWRHINKYSATIKNNEANNKKDLHLELVHILVGLMTQVVG